MRMSMRQLTRLTRSQSESRTTFTPSLHYIHFNFVRIYKSLRCTPAIAAGVTEHLWEIENIVKLLDQ